MKAMGLIYFDLYKKTYKLSDRFTKELQSIGIIWGQEMRKTVDSKKWG